MGEFMQRGGGEQEPPPAAPPAAPASAQVAPAPSGGSGYASILDTGNEFIIAQTRKGCIQEMCGCEANSEFTFHDHSGAQVGIIEEQTSCCIRFCCKNSRPWTTKMAAGTDINGPAILTFERPFRCAANNCKCCCYQEVAVLDGNGGVDMGKATEKCWYCVPNFATVKPDGNDEYQFHMPTCCGGMCVNVCAQGCCNCRIPFLIYPPGGDDANPLKAGEGCKPVPGMETEKPDAQICKVGGGLATEVFTDADTFEFKAPAGADASAKARLIGATLLLNQIYFEGGEE